MCVCVCISVSDKSWNARKSAGEAFIPCYCNLKYLKPVCLIRWGGGRGVWGGRCSFGGDGGLEGSVEGRGLFPCGAWRGFDVNIWCFGARKELPRRGWSSCWEPPAQAQLHARHRSGFRMGCKSRRLCIKCNWEALWIGETFIWLQVKLQTNTKSLLAKY